MTKLGEALRAKYQSPRDALKALGLDEALLKDTTEHHDMSKPTRFAANALILTSGYVRPILAKDAKIDLMPIFKDLTPKTFKAKDVTLALDAALKGKLAKDASMEHVAEMLDHLEHKGAEKGEDESVSEPQHKAMEAAAHGESNIGIPKKVGEEFSQADKGKTFDAEPLKNFLKEKGMSEDDVSKVMDMMPENALDEAETEEERKEREKKAADEKMEEEKKAADAKRAHDEEMKNMVSKTAMDAALAATAKSVRETERGIRVALQTVKPYVGELPETLAFDSADDVLRHALGMMKVPDAKTMHADALPHVLATQRKAGAKPAETDVDVQLGMDGAGKSFAERHPEAARIQPV